MGYTTWNSLLTTPAHPEYSSAHAVLSSSAAAAFSFLFGKSIGNFTDHTYDYMNLPPRSYDSFQAIGEDAGYSRIYAGIHYLPSIKTGLLQGRKVTSNIISVIKNENGNKK
jgi:membrane-associated phospholipid phosphatase